jgi:hypothetical protein
MGATQVQSNLEFIQELRSCVARYLKAVDAWEAEYHKYYRLATPHQTVSPDLEEAQSAYVAARRQMEALIPRARDCAPSSTNAIFGRDCCISNWAPMRRKPKLHQPLAGANASRLRIASPIWSSSAASRK